MSAPTGTFNLLKNGNTIGFSLPLDANGNATFAYTTGSGDEPQDVFAAVYNGDATHNTSSGTATVTVGNPIQETVTTVTPDKNSVSAGDVITLTINVANA